MKGGGIKGKKRGWERIPKVVQPHGKMEGRGTGVLDVGERKEKGEADSYAYS